uniref:Uncharacterized protein n=1 Tax=Tetranychus urticae TaxID=32264 RepID=T1K3P1_TETUR
MNGLAENHKFAINTDNGKGYMLR